MTGMPDGLKTRVEQLSGISLDHVRVHYNSDKPAEVGALAYAQGTDIHIGPGQEQHLPHEAWHVVQQAQGRVKPTKQMKGSFQVNDDQGLEREADVMGQKAVQTTAEAAITVPDELTSVKSGSGSNPAQLRDLIINGKKLSNYDNAMKNKEFAKAITAMSSKYDASRVQYFAKQLFSSPGANIPDLERFIIELQYDLETKLPDSEDMLTLQQRYLTSYGWHLAEHTPDKVAKLDKTSSLKLYRTMSIKDWKAIQAGDYSVLKGGHLGDFKQALKYFLGKSSDSKVMVEFTLKAGAEARLFGGSLAFPKERSSKLQQLGKVIGADSYPLSSKSEGTSDEHIGIKSESEGEAGFSIGIGGGDVTEQFHQLVDTVALKEIGDRYSNENNADGIKSRVEADANLLLHVNNCLINAIALAALGREASLDELIAIRSQMNNYGEMLLATDAVVDLIRQELHIANPITVIYTSMDEPGETFDGVGEELMIFHVNGNHFTHESPFEPRERDAEGE